MMRYLSAVVILYAGLVLAAFCADTNTYSIYLVEMDMGLPDLGNGCAAWGDYDQDGFLDLIFSGRDSNGLQAAIYHNEGGTIYSNIHAAVPGGEVSSADWGDYDCDGDLDLVYCGYISNQTHSTFLFRNDGASAFTEITNHGLPGVSSGSVRWGDYDNDGLLDVALCGYHGVGTNLTRIYRNLGSGAFCTNPIVLTGVRDGRATWGDYDHDSYPDLLLNGDTGDGRITRIYRNENGSTFSNTAISLPAIAQGSVDWVDFNTDGYDDISVAGYAAGGPLTRLYRHLGTSNTYKAFNTNTLPACWLGATAWGDYDNDGDPDVLIDGIGTNGGLLTQLYLNVETGNLTQVSIALPPMKQSCVQWVDLNGDDALDLFICGRDTNGQYQTYTFSNHVFVTNMPPGPPSNLCAVITNDFGLSLSWDSAVDGQSPSETLWYNLFVGTASNRGDVITPMADIETGRRYPCRLVNGCKPRMKAIARIPANTVLYWGVQAVDANGLGGPFAFGEPMIRSPFPDFAVVGIVVQQVPYTVTVTVSNAGVVDAAAGVLAFWLNHADTATGTNDADRIVSIGELAVGTETNVTFSDFAAPSAIVTNVMRAYINAEGAFTEECITNNQYTYSYTTVVYDPFTFNASALRESVLLRWSDPIASGLQSDRVHLRASFTGYPAELTDGALLYEGTNRVFCHMPLTPGRTCYYTIWVSHDGTNFIYPPQTDDENE